MEDLELSRLLTGKCDDRMRSSAFMLVLVELMLWIGLRMLMSVSKVCRSWHGFPRRMSLTYRMIR